MLILIVLTLAILSIAISTWVYLPKILKELKSLTAYLEDTLFKPKKISKKQEKINKKIEKENEKFREMQHAALMREIKFHNQHFDGN